MCWILLEKAKEELAEYQYSHKIKKENRNKENYSPQDSYYEDIDEYEYLAW